MSENSAKPELVGVVHPLVFEEWKRAALVFDHLRIEELHFRDLTRTSRDSYFDRYFKDQAREVNWLADQGVLRSVRLSQRGLHVAFEDAFDEAFEKENARRRQLRWLSSEDHDHLSVSRANIISRRLSCELRGVGENAMPVLSRLDSTVPDGTAAEMTRVVLKGIPRLDDTVAWQDILEFRNEEMVRLFHRDLRNWIVRQASTPLINSGRSESTPKT